MIIKIIVLREDVLYQVKSEAYITGEAQKNGDAVAESQAAKTQASDEDDYLLNTYIDSALSAVKDVLSGHLTSASSDEYQAKTDAGNDTTKFVLSIDVPSTFDLNQTESLKEGIRNYLAQYALMRWYKRVNPAMADPTELDQIRSDINHRINQRVRPVRRPVLGINL